MVNITRKKILSFGLSASLVFGSVLTYTSSAFAQNTSQKSYKSSIERLNLKADSTGKVKTSAVQSDKKEDKLSEDTLIVKFNTPLPAVAHNKIGTKLIKRISSLHYDIVQVTNKKKLQDVMKAYALLPEVASVTRSAFYKKLATPDLKANDMYYLKTLQVDQANKLAGKNPVRVALIDTGIDAKHPELKNKIISNYNVLNPLQKGAPDVHGTHVAGIIGAEKGNGLGGYGVNPNVKIISIDVFNRTYFTNDFTIAEGILEAIRQKAQVINMSLGSWYPSPIVQDAVNKALAANITIVAAAGNDGMNTMEYPAAFDGVISVGATNSRNQLSNFSTYGPSVDVVAPGEGIYSSVYDVDKKSSFATLDGTSMAAPMVTGAVSLLLSKYPNLKPYQINYILDESAKDLGSKGFDIKYGHGLIDPVAALKFPIKSLPASPVSSEKDVLNAAKSLQVPSTLGVSGEMKQINQVDWYKFDVKKGDDIQTKLTGSVDYDYEYHLLFYPKGKTVASKKVTVNDVLENKVEGNLYQAPDDGTLVIGVKDANGNYNKNHRSTYKLQIDRSTEPFDDKNTVDTAITIKSLPFQSLSDVGQMYFTNELNQQVEKVSEEVPTNDEQKPMPGDTDYFHFVAPETESGSSSIVQAKLSSVPGINSSINLYIVEKDGDTEQTYMIDNMDQYGFGEGETLTFEAIPGNEYVIEVSNKPFFDPFYYYPIDNNLDLERSYSSDIAYNLSVESKDLPSDEDQFPMIQNNPDETAMGALAEGDIKSYYKKKAELQSTFIEPSMYFGDNDYFDQVKEASQPYAVGQKETGYFQYMGDEDWFQFTPTKNAIYQFTFDRNEQSEIPWVDVMTFDAEQNTFTMVGSNWMNTTNNQLNSNYNIGLKANQTYYFKLANEIYRPSLKSYSFTSKVLLENPGDQYEDNDTYEKATTIGFGKIQGNFASSQDQDIFYFKPAENGIYGFNLQPLAVPSKYAKLPKELLTPLDTIVIVIEDKNGNKKLDKDEEGNYTITDYGFTNVAERGSFEGTKGMGYFIVTLNYSSEQANVTPYDFTLAKTNQADEDKGSVLKQNIPTKPITFKQVSKTEATQSAYINVTTNKGDQDYFKYVASANATYKIKVDVPIDLDAVITLYDGNGHLIAKADQYGKGDYEVLVKSLQKGTYFIKVEDVFGNASISPYQVTVTK